MEQSVEIPVGRYSSVSALVGVRASPVVVIATHPWGPMGGSMYDPHPTTVCKVFGEAGCSTARFNFRGGIGWGEASAEDVKAVADWFTKPQDDKAPLASQVLLVGYSYGALIAAAAGADIPEMIGWTTIAPALDYAWAIYLFNGRSLRAKAAIENKPKLVIGGTNDVFCSESTLRGFADELPEPKQVIVMEGLDHFSHYSHLRRTMAEWIASAFAVRDLREFAQVGANSSR
mmetsp:Transcript_63292/g.115394  ORF Transcript_63292/g.115394 Transcript_63292/m.115394 type:complete len:231 (-) Transcript_63292:25-717(-)